MKKITRQLIFYIGLIALWEGVHRAGLVPQTVLPSPGQVFGWLWVNLSSPELFGGIGMSLGRIILGYAIGLFLGVAVGIVMSQSRFLDSTLGPLILGLQTVPNICWVPLLILWFGPTESAIIVNIVLGSFLSITIGTDMGFKGVSLSYLNAARNMGAKGLTLSFYVSLPAALPAIIAGMKQGWAFAWRGLISAEMIFATFGLGNFLMKGKDQKDMVQVMSLMVVIVFLGWLANRMIFTRLENWVRRKWGLEKA